MGEKADNVFPPRRATVNSLEARNIQYVAITTTSARTLLDARIRNRWVRVRAVGADATFCFSPDNTGSVDHALTGAQPVTADIGDKLLDGEHIDYQLGGQDNYIIVDGSASGTLVLCASGPARNGNTFEGP